MLRVNPSIRTYGGSTIRAELGLTKCLGAFTVVCVAVARSLQSVVSSTRDGPSDLPCPLQHNLLERSRSAVSDLPCRS